MAMRERTLARPRRWCRKPPSNLETAQTSASVSCSSAGRCSRARCTHHARNFNQSNSLPPVGARAHSPNPDRFTPTRYRMIVRYKTAYYTFYLPCAIGMIYAGVKDPASYRLARDICCRIGEFFQIQDDFLDCFGDPKVIGKVGTDIQDNKCSWLVVQALERASKAQKAVLVENYAIDDEAKVRIVRFFFFPSKAPPVLRFSSWCFSPPLPPRSYNVQCSLLSKKN